MPLKVIPGALNTLVTVPRPLLAQPWGLLPDFLVGHLVSVSSENDCVNSKSIPHVSQW